MDKIQKIVHIEWLAQKIVQDSQKTGPLVKILYSRPSDKNKPMKSYHNTHYLIMQGSFDPPAVSHFILLKNAIKLQKKLYPDDTIELIILLSLSHVEKRINVLHQSLLGFRFEMIEDLIQEFSAELQIPVTLGLSNCARYLDLITGIKRRFQNIKLISFIMGIDVFKKIFDPKYYTKPLRELLPRLFQAKYLVAGRDNIISENEFFKFVDPKIPRNSVFNENISFISMPKHFQHFSASLIREKIRFNEDIHETELFFNTMNYIKEYKLYTQVKKNLTTYIMIQTVVRLIIEVNGEEKTAQSLIRSFINEIEEDIELQDQIIYEYRMGDVRTIRRRWMELSKLTS